MNIKLYHYSDIDIQAKIKVKFFAENFYTQKSKELCSLCRSYFYIDEDKREGFFRSSKFKYTVIINKNKLYDLGIDNLKLGKKFGNNYYEFMYYLKKKGYKGFIGFNGLRIAQLFYDVAYNEKIQLN